ncbi:MAG: GspE/PulE family protein [Patescibacteria group bacterium]|nr:GspE/PulE family protein [Patescibacteria group bacterium]MDD5121100.1 GspE/PulE family protein [Patescibacteria group bacterium]MDD5221928.1 GspE/PulE family protein [Patescibacteria group bacterium]MDD5395981.1 GspE/PulE family protein [Patescibacteria group bacterium]
MSIFKSNSKPTLASDETAEKLQNRLEDIQGKELEEQTNQRAFTLGLPYINLTAFPIAPEALALVSEEDAKQYHIICFYKNDREAKLATIDPESHSMAEFRANFGHAHDLKTELYLISSLSFNHAYKLYAALPKVSKIIQGVEIKEEDLKKFQAQISNFSDLNQQIQKVSISDLLTLLIASAIQSRSSDVHIEAEENEIKIRFRIDGVLIEVAALAKKLWPQVISRLKLISGLKINVTDRPQDGRFTIYLTDDKVDVRVSCLPTAFGESVVMRLLRSASVGLGFEDLGLRSPAFDQLSKQIVRPNGMVITTGPTGSGKTTTLYAILNKLNNPETKIITLEDPIEYKLNGINQSQVDYAKDYTFAKGLKSILRQDPDIVMVGEIRDLETAETAIQAALTGHLVVSTLHTNDAAGAIPRFLSIGVKPYLLSPALNAIMGQRLVRKICLSCKKEITLDQEVLEKVKKLLTDLPADKKQAIGFNENWQPKFFTGSGCPSCHGLGYQGRLGIYEVLLMSPEIEKVILSGQVSEYQMRDLAKQQGMITMAQDGLLKALDGLTTVDEVFRVAE